MYEWLSSLQQELILGLSSATDVTEMIYSLLVSLLVFPLELFYVLFYFVFGTADDLNSVAFIDAKIIALSVIFGGFFYRAFSESNKISLNVSRWLLSRMVSYLGALFATMTLITFFTQVASSAGVVLGRSLDFSLSSYLVGLFFLACLVFLFLLKGLKLHIFNVQRNGLGRKV